VVSIESVSRRSVSDILRYRSASHESSERFREYLRELEAELIEEPWSARFHEHIRATVNGRILPEVRRVREAKAEIWQRLFDEAVTTVLSSKNVAIASGAWALKLGVFPSITYVELMCAAGGGLAAEVLPSLLSARRAQDKVRRNSLFFIVALGE